MCAFFCCAVEEGLNIPKSWGGFALFPPIYVNFAGSFARVSEHRPLCAWGRNARKARGSGASGNTSWVKTMEQVVLRLVS